MPLIQVGYKKIHYADWKPSNGESPRETFVFGMSYPFFNVQVAPDVLLCPEVHLLTAIQSTA